MSRYGTPGEMAGSFVALAGLLILAFVTGLSAIGFALTATICSSEDPGLLCSDNGPGLAMWVPTGAAIVAGLIGMAGIAIGRPLRLPFLVSGYVITVLGFLAGLAIAMTGPAS